MILSLFPLVNPRELLHFNFIRLTKRNRHTEGPMETVVMETLRIHTNSTSTVHTDWPVCWGFSEGHSCRRVWLGLCHLGPATTPVRVRARRPLCTWGSSSGPPPHVPCWGPWSVDDLQNTHTVVIVCFPPQLGETSIANPLVRPQHIIIIIIIPHHGELVSTSVHILRPPPLRRRFVY